MFAVGEDDGPGESEAGAAVWLRIVHPIVDSAGRIDRVAVGCATGWRVYGGSADGGIPTGLRAAPRPVAMLVVTVAAISAGVSVGLSQVLSLVGITSGRSWGVWPLGQGVSPPTAVRCTRGTGRGSSGRGGTFLPYGVMSTYPPSELRRQAESGRRVKGYVRS